MYEEELERLLARLRLSEADGLALRELFRRATTPDSARDTVLIGDDEAADVEVDDMLELGRPNRYLDLGPIARGGMGDIRRVRDANLNRTVVMKVLRRDRAQMRMMHRFLEEAQATAQLQHPNIVPVHEMGRLPNGRVYFTMREVRGQTLTRALREVHRASRGGQWGTAADGTTFRRLMDAFHQACNAMAYAHDRGVVHRDIKPDNIMLGPYGEVQVMDWGIAKVLDADTEDPLELQSGRMPTREGRVSGTPHYMAPEQAFGSSTIGPQVDVYGLGAVLYELLSSRPPFQGADSRAVLKQVRRGDRPPPLRAAQETFAETRSFSAAELRGGERPLPLPADLVRICEKAMALEPVDRYDDAGAMAAAVGEWLDGVRHTAAARGVIEEVGQLLPRSQSLRARAEELRADAARRLAAVPRWAAAELKAPAWELEDEADELLAEADGLDIDAEGLLRGALALAPGFREAHAALAVRYRDDHLAAEERRDRREELRFEVALRAHTLKLPEGDELRDELLEYLEGTGRLRLRTQPAATSVHLERWVQRGRRLVGEPVDPIEPAQLASVRLPMGSYLLRLQAPGTIEVRYPISLGRQGRWTSRRPGAAGPRPVVLPVPDQLGDDDRYVAGGWTTILGPPTDQAERRVWVDSFVIRRFPVTVAEYIAFLDDLAATGRVGDAHLHAPSANDAPILAFEDGKFRAVPDAEGDVLKPDWPIVHVDWDGARAFAAWAAHRDRLPWRLPTQWEWEKAARGVDGRMFPWGAQPEDSWARTRFSHRERAMLGPVGDYPLDESPYGVRGMAGNVQEWCGDDFDALPGAGEAARPAAVDRVRMPAVRGGHWAAAIRFLRLGAARLHRPPGPDADAGIPAGALVRGRRRRRDRGEDTAVSGSASPSGS